MFLGESRDHLFVIGRGLTKTLIENDFMLHWFWPLLACGLLLWRSG